MEGCAGSTLRQGFGIGGRFEVRVPLRDVAALSKGTGELREVNAGVAIAVHPIEFNLGSRRPLGTEKMKKYSTPNQIKTSPNQTQLPKILGCVLPTVDLDLLVAGLRRCDGWRGRWRSGGDARCVEIQDPGRDHKSQENHALGVGRTAPRRLGLQRKKMIQKCGNGSKSHARILQFSFNRKQLK